MTKFAESSLRKGLLLVTTAVAAVGAILSLPVKKALAAMPQIRPAGPMAVKPQVKLVVIQPRFVSPSAANLMRIATQALSNPTLAEQIFRDPDAVAKQFHLSPAETLVLHHMDRAQFATARADAARLVGRRMASGQPMPAGATNTLQITEGMIVGRAILAAVGRSYLSAASANACCPWSKAIEIGVGGDPASYNSAFAPVAGAG